MAERPKKRARQWYEPPGSPAAAAATEGGAAAAPAGSAPAAGAPTALRGDRPPIHVLAVSDTHDLDLPDFLEQLPTVVPSDGGHRPGEHVVDVLVHTGDFETASDGNGRYDRGINGWFGRQRGIPWRLLVAGNHDHTHGITKKPIVADQPTDPETGETQFKPGAVRGHCTNKFNDDAIYTPGRRGFRPAVEADNDTSAFQLALGVPEQCVIHNAIYLQDNGIDVAGWRIFGTPWHGLHP